MRSRARALLRNPLRVVMPGAGAGASAPRIHQRAVQVDEAQRTRLLRNLTRAEGWARVLVFVGTQSAADRVALICRQNGGVLILRR